MGRKRSPVKHTNRHVQSWSLFQATFSPSPVLHLENGKEKKSPEEKNQTSSQAKQKTRQEKPRPQRQKQGF